MGGTRSRCFNSGYHDLGLSHGTCSCIPTVLLDEI